MFTHRYTHMYTHIYTHVYTYIYTWFFPQLLLVKLMVVSTPRYGIPPCLPKVLSQGGGMCIGLYVYPRCTHRSAHIHIFSLPMCTFTCGSSLIYTQYTLGIPIYVYHGFTSLGILIGIPIGMTLGLSLGICLNRYNSVYHWVCTLPRYVYSWVCQLVYPSVYTYVHTYICIPIVYP